jgi:hypothetical protein
MGQQQGSIPLLENRNVDSATYYDLTENHNGDAAETAKKLYFQVSKITQAIISEYTEEAIVWLLIPTNWELAMISITLRYVLSPCYLCLTMISNLMG